MKKAFVGRVPDESKVTEFLEHCSLYDNSAKRWRDIPDEKIQHENVLYSPIREILQAVVDYFGYSDSREVFDTHKVQYPSHRQEGSGNNDATKDLKSSPDIMIRARGSVSKNFMFKPEPLKRQDYTRGISPTEVKTQRNRRLFDNICQTAVYARQCFIQQHNRKAVYCLIITEKIVQICMFDRSGVYHSVDINIHENAADFVRLILGVVSPDEEVVGFDTTVFWDKKTNERFLTTVNHRNEFVRYKLACTRPVFYRRAIVGRGTCCWKVMDAQGNLFIVKDAWRSRGRVPEAEFIESVKGLVGVGQMVAFEDRDHISDLRGIEMATIPEDLKSAFRDRILARITSKYGGQPIDMFNSAQEVLYAFRDAIAGHRNLWNAKILHRDVSVNNILIGANPFDIGNRGLIIDLDMAIRIDRDKSLAGQDFRTGTRAFQSVNVLNSYSSETSTVPHDYLDDLESFFYVLCWICCGHDRPKPQDFTGRHPTSLPEKTNPRKIVPFPAYLIKWETHDPSQAADSKRSMFIVPRFTYRITTLFKEEAGPVFPNLLEKLYQFFKEHMVRKMAFLDDDTRPSLMELVPTAAGHYEAVLKIFDDAIAEFLSFTASVKAQEHTEALASTPAAPAPTTPTKRHSARLPLSDYPPNGSVSQGSRPFRKRASDSELPLDESPMAKKSRTYSQSKLSLSISLNDED
ncbi:hypothetical protein GALMADRAFT_234869 [Galerina marginata CBS 339.88]|uniref:Protein kinase domain-containing protein n=1 Tax=Galerina marginata (strain CBS 339.88) TaxID=685588 RepID=A0A067TRD1_GALM3|nr:hypothetical protein GALMADRAFT_234869 [Galerina marginata CBS 339.88]